MPDEIIPNCIHAEKLSPSLRENLHNWYCLQQLRAHIVNEVIDSGRQG